MEQYTKIVHFGESIASNIKIGNVQIEEKVDGSQFRIYGYKNELQFGSKSVTYTEERPPDGMFNKAVENVKKILCGAFFNKPTHIFCEFLRSPKHNTLAYDRVPTNNLVVFDVKKEDKFLNFNEMKEYAISIGFEVTPLLWQGDGSELNLDLLNKLLQEKSFLGGQLVEGVVIKNYNQFYTVPYLLGKPIFAKYVREDFKELNTKTWKTSNKHGFMSDLIERYTNQARWLKAVQHLRDAEQLTNSPKDIGEIIKEVQKDIGMEEGENIKNEIFKYFWKNDISKGIIRGLPQWYKEQIAKGEIQ